MASLTTTMASFVGGGVAATKRPGNSHPLSIVTAKAVTTAQSQDVVKQSHVANEEKGSNHGRRAAMLAAAAAAISAVGPRQSVAVAGEEPKPGTPEAKKLYAPVCVTMPTARICHK